MVLRWLIPKVLHSLQDQGRHCGVDKIIEEVSEICWWPEYTKDVQPYIHTCQQCARKKQPKNPIQADLQSIPVEGPMEMSAMDFVRPLPTSNNQEVICRYGVPAVIHSDRETDFEE